MMETALTNAIAIVIAGIFVVLALPYFSDLIGREITLSLLFESRFWIVLAGMI